MKKMMKILSSILIATALLLICSCIKEAPVQVDDKTNSPVRSAAKSSTIVEVSERDVKLRDLPVAIKTAVQERYPEARIREADRVQYSDGSVSYDVEIKYRGKVLEPMFTSNGTFLGEDDDDDSDDLDDEDGSEEDDNK